MKPNASHTSLGIKNVGHTYKMADSTVECSDTEKVLGVMVDNLLNTRDAVVKRFYDSMMRK